MTNFGTNPPDLSVLVTVVDGGVSLERCLTALATQTNLPAMEVLICYDHISQDVREFASRFPQFTFIDLGDVLGGRIPKNELERHKFFDNRRSEAMKIARGPLVAILEDRGVPQHDWAAAMVELHNNSPYAVIGGAVENGVDRSLNWAAFICDFGRYQAPLANDAPEFVSDTNICYKREALEGVRHVWEERYDEARVNWALRRNGEKLMLCEKPCTLQMREPMGLVKMIKERVHWGRNFGQSRVREMNQAQRLKLCVLMPALPLVLFVRHFRCQLAKGKKLKQFVFASPALLLLLIFWTLGEFIGYCEGTPAQENLLSSSNYWKYL